MPPPWGRRPVLLLSRDEAYEFLTWVIAAPLTTRVWDVPTTVPLDPRDDGVPRHSAVSLDNIQAVRKTWLDTLVVPLRPEKMRAVERAIHFALGLRE